MFNVDVHNLITEDRADVVVVEVRETETGFTHYLGWQTFSIDSDGDYVMTFSWIAPEPGTYLLRAFAFDGLEPEDLRTLSPIYESEQLVVDSN